MDVEQTFADNMGVAPNDWVWFVIAQAILLNMLLVC